MLALSLPRPMASLVEVDVVVIGGGIAGVSLAEELHRLAPNATVLILSASRSLRGVRSVVKVTSTVDSLEIEEVSLDFLASKTRRAGCRGFIDSRFGHVVSMDTERKELFLASGESVKYTRACAICTGARPRGLWLHSPASSAGSSAAAGTTSLGATLPQPLVVRDTNSVRQLGRCLKAATARARGARASRVLLVGNGPIACEMALALRAHHRVLWVMREGYAGRSLLDATASRFFLESRASPPASSRSTAASPQAGDAGKGSDSLLAGTYGNALGPNWVDLLLEESSAAPFAAGGTAASAGPALGEASDEDVDPSAAGVLDQSAAGPGLTLLRLRELVACRAAAGGASTSPAWVAVSEEAAAAPVPASEPGWDGAVGCQLRAAGGRTGEDGCAATLVLEADVVVAAVGVSPQVGFCPEALVRAADGGLLVNKAMQVLGGGGRVFAAGDAASVGWATADSSPSASSLQGAGTLSGLEDDGDVDLGGDHWFQMRLWTQARVLGAYAGARIAAHALTAAERGRGALSPLELEGGYNLDLFAHCTALGGHKVVLLGRFNGQGLGPAFEEAVRGLEAPGIAPEAPATGTGTEATQTGPKTESWRQIGTSAALASPGAPSQEVAVQVSWLPGHHYMKLVLQGGKVVGAVLIGDTDMEEAVERLIQGGHCVGDADLTDPELDIDAILD